MAGARGKLTEADVIALAVELFPSSSSALLTGIGDDCAVLAPASGGALQLVTTDTLVEGVHFDLRYMALGDVGWKALAVSVSDIAAMGGSPRHAVAQLGIPAAATRRQVSALAQGVADCARSYGVSVVGGDTFAAPQWQLGFTLLGDCGSQPLLRSGGRAGHELWLAGQPGMSQAGLHLLWAKAAGIRLGSRALLNKLGSWHSRPQPDARLGMQLVRLGASAAIDTSDSLAQSLLHLAAGSGCGMEVDFSALRCAAEIHSFASACRSYSGADPASAGFSIPAAACPEGRDLHFASLTDFLLYSAEDYSLLLCALPSAAAALDALPQGLQRIGRLLPARRGRHYIDEHGTQHQLMPIGWQHR